MWGIAKSYSTWKVRFWKVCFNQSKGLSTEREYNELFGTVLGPQKLLACKHEPKSICIMCLKRMISAKCSANIFRAISHFTTLRVTQTVGKRWCSVVPSAASHSLPIPLCPNLSLPYKLGRHGFGFQRLTKGLPGFTSCVESIAFNGLSTAPRYLCFSQKKKKKKVTEKTWPVSLPWNCLGGFRPWWKIHWTQNKRPKI